MPLAPGTKLGPYEIIAPLGEGGMGEVYKARDTRLDRTVALKISKSEFTERFDREARAVAALNHPNICQLYDVGPNYLVMELIEGAPLKGPLPIAQAVEYAKQILDALDAAHRKGITHRDLKPANILVTKQGIKLLDFGLAKHNPPLQQTDATLTKGLTGDGQILGTLQYMAPEQLQGKPADARSDIFSFGCVLYEIIGGKKAFHGASSSVIAAIIERDPAPLEIDKPLDRVIRKCLAKDPDDRFQTARDLKYNLSLALEPHQTQKSANWPWTAIAIAAATTLIIGAIGGTLFTRQTPARSTAIRFQLHPPEGGRFSQIGAPALSPDGRTVAFSAMAQGKSGLWLRSLDGTAARYLPGTASALSSIWSPDGRSIAYSTGGALMRVELDGGTPVTIYSATASLGFWTTDGRIVISLFGAPFLRSIPASGGQPQPFTQLDANRGERSHTEPQLLPGGRLLFPISADQPENWGVFASSLTNPSERIRLLPGAAYAFYAAGYLLWPKGSSLVAQPFDAESLKFSGEAQPVSDLVNLTRPPASSGNNLVYNPGRGANESQFRWRDRSGADAGTLGKPAHYSWFRLSPDGRRLVADRFVQEERHLWIADLGRDVWSCLTFLPDSRASHPVWSPDNRRILFAAGAPANLHWKESSGAGTEQRIAQSPNRQWSTDWSRDGRFILYYELSPDTQRDIWILPINPDGTPETAKARPYFRTRSNESMGKFSPEPSPRWVAYRSDESGLNEIVIQAFPEPHGKWQVSTGGGDFPEWSPDGRELFYVSPDRRLMAVSLQFSGDSVQPSTPRELFRLPEDDTPASTYAVAPDGKRFLVRAATDQDSKLLEVIVNWPALLKSGK